MMININDEKKSDIVYKTNDNKYKTLFNNMKNPYVYHQIIWDGNGKPVDFRIIEANKAFEDISGLRMDNIIGKKISEVIPNIVKEPINNLKRYEKAVLEESEATFEQYWSRINRWYRIKAYSPERGYFATIFEDITKEKEKLI
jgi:PAS domain S-box-containing protein